MEITGLPESWEDAGAGRVHLCGKLWGSGVGRDGIKASVHHHIQLKLKERGKISIGGTENSFSKFVGGGNLHKQIIHSQAKGV